MPSKPLSSKLKATKKDEATFSEVVKLIAASKQKAFQAVNTTLIDLYWKIGATISRKIETAEWGDGVVEQLAQFIARTEPGLECPAFFEPVALIETGNQGANDGTTEEAYA